MRGYVERGEEKAKKKLWKRCRNVEEEETGKRRRRREIKKRK